MVLGRAEVGYLVPRDWASGPRAMALRRDSQGFYQYDDDLMNHGRNSAFSFWSSAKYILILSLMLWWIPTFGQMIAGYVGGRKAGNHWKAALAAILPVILIWVIALTAEASSTFPQLTNLLALPAMAMYGVGDVIPFFDPSIGFIVSYITAFILALRDTLGMGLNGYMVTIIFAYIGGLMAVQNLREKATEVEPEENPLALPSYYPYQPRVATYEPLLPRQRIPLAAPRSWYAPHRERYDYFRRIPVAPTAYEEEPLEYYEPEAQPVQRRLEDPYDLGEVYPPPQEPVTEAPPRRRLKRLDREELIRRLVERALREYDRSVR